ncbi:MAG: twin-arginine translocase TatA/TatE family subunit [Chloroflexi bacterium]|nr:twin-arginine translocase TatA/TatE family subunit [Chloroflexota bacterium]MBE42810.1 twin-arginine translocase TatA/TatE family subunit [Chloroflexota bacterium]MQG00684.1 twin-arginine translocase TatA/TatE family subunit [SAR202 cluster bacterium]
MPFRFGPMELIIVLVVVLIIFGVGRLPEIGGAMGKAIKEFRNTQKNQPESDINPVDKDAKDDIKQA